MIKTAMILSAGLGQRLRPLTLLKPKPLIEVLNKSMLEWWIESLCSSGVKRLVINVHHQAKMMMDKIESLSEGFKGRLEIFVSLEDKLLGTGGGIKKAAPLLGEGNFLLVNSDIFTDFELVKLSLKQLAHPGRLATLGLLEKSVRPELANVSLGEDGRILAFRETEAVEGEIKRLAYCGAMAISSEIFGKIKEDEFCDIIDIFNTALKEGAEIVAWEYDPAIWSDMGTPKEYWKLNEFLACARTIIHPSACAEGSLSGWNVLGDNSLLEKGASIENCVLWPYSQVSSGSQVKNAVVAGVVPPGKIIEGGVFCGEADIAEN